VFFCNAIRVIINAIPCESCRTHAKTYLRSHHLNAQGDCFLYVYQFDNAVRKRIRKPELDPMSVYSLHSHCNPKTRGAELLKKLHRALPKPCRVSESPEMDEMARTNLVLKYERVVELVHSL